MRGREIAPESMLEAIDKLESGLSGKKFIQIDDCRNITVVGDIHGDIDSLDFILENSKSDAFIFLGDYGDRGENSSLVYMRLAELSSEKDVFLLRGNHETSTAFPHELPHELDYRFGERGREIYLRLKELWEKLPYSAVIRDKYWLAHGGVPTDSGKIETAGLNFKEIENPGDATSMEIMWNDPWERELSDFNYERGVGMFFGWRATEILLETVEAKTVIRSHQPYKILLAEQNGLVVTVGSCMRPYGLSRASYLEIDCSDRARNGYELISDCATTFSI